MAEQLFLSFWLRGFRAETMLRQFGRMLERFPFSTQATNARVLKIYAIEFAEPCLIERQLPLETGAEEVVEIAGEFLNDDSCYQLDACWDLWQYDNGWRLGPSPVTLACFGPQFANEWGDNLRIEAGLDSHFLPQPQFPDSASKVQSNIRGLLRLADDLDGELPVEKRMLWSESGERFTERLQAELP